MVNKKIKLIGFDGDGTSWFYPNLGIYGSSWDAVSDACGVLEEVKELLNFYYPRPELYVEWVKKQAELFKGKNVGDIERQVYPVPYTKGFVDFINSVRGKVLTCLLTTGLEIPARRVQSELGIDSCFCTYLDRVNGCLSGTVREEVPLWEKGRVFERVLKEHSVRFDEAAFIGDSKGDIPCFNLCSRGIAYNPKDQETRSTAKFVIEDHRQLNELLDI